MMGRRWAWPWGALNYSLTKAVAFMRISGWELKGHVLIIGPLAFCICWRKPLQ
jgi:hypothetical protein